MTDMQVTLIDTMGDDLRVVNAARVSFNKQSEWEHTGDDEYLNEDTREIELVPRYKLLEKDEKLINYLAKHGHWTPFAHCMATFRIKAPIFVARQLFKHQVGLVVNEVSRRYVDTEPEFYMPDLWRRRAKDKKQGSSNQIVDPFDGPENGENWQEYDCFQHDLNLYKYLLLRDVAPEQARMVLPQNMMTEWFWTGSLIAFSRICQLRIDEHAQEETKQVAEKISEIMIEKFPISWKALYK